MYIHVRRKFSFRYPIPMQIQSSVALQSQQNVEMFAQTCQLWDSLWTQFEITICFQNDFFLKQLWSICSKTTSLFVFYFNRLVVLWWFLPLDFMATDLTRTITWPSWSKTSQIIPLWLDQKSDPFVNLSAKYRYRFV